MILYLLNGGFKSPYFISYILFGVLWIFISTVIRVNIKEKQSAAYNVYTIIRIFIGLAYLLGLFAIIVVIGITSQPVAFM